MNTDEIITHCLRGIREVDTDTPIMMSREQVLSYCNHLYQDKIGLLLNKITSVTLTVEDGKASLPADYLAPVRVYDGGTLLTQIFDIDDKLDNDAPCQQYWIPNEQEIHFFGQTPAGTVTLYYKAKPEALTDSSSSSPVDLKPEFHLEPFVCYTKQMHAFNRNNLADKYALNNELLDWLDEIRYAHSAGRRNIEPERIDDVYS